MNTTPSSKSDKSEKGKGWLRKNVVPYILPLDTKEFRWADIRNWLKAKQETLETMSDEFAGTIDDLKTKDMRKTHSAWRMMQGNVDTIDWGGLVTDYPWAVWGENAETTKNEAEEVQNGSTTDRGEKERLRNRLSKKLEESFKYFEDADAIEQIEEMDGTLRDTISALQKIKLWKAAYYKEEDARKKIGEMKENMEKLDKFRMEAIDVAADSSKASLINIQELPKKTKECADLLEKVLEELPTGTDELTKKIPLEENPMYDEGKKEKWTSWEYIVHRVRQSLIPLFLMGWTVADKSLPVTKLHSPLNWVGALKKEEARKEYFRQQWKNVYEKWCSETNEKRKADLQKELDELENDVKDNGGKVDDLKTPAKGKSNAGNANNAASNNAPEASPQSLGRGYSVKRTGNQIVIITPKDMKHKVHYSVWYAKPREGAREFRGDAHSTDETETTFEIPAEIANEPQISVVLGFPKDGSWDNQEFGNFATFLK